MPRISIIIPAYNCSRVLIRALHYALKQTVDKEIIIINDASTDGTQKVIDNMAKNNPCIKAIHMKKNVGPGLCRNIGLKIAEGDFIAFLDADDIYPDRRSLQRMCDLADTKSVCVCGSLRQLRFIFRTVEVEDYREACIKEPEGPVLLYQDIQCDYDFTSYIYRRELLENIEFPDLRRYQDVPFLVKAMVKAERFTVCAVEGYRYTMHARHPYVFDERSSHDLLLAMKMVIDIAKIERLDNLLEKTKSRLLNEYSKKIMPFLQDEDLITYGEIMDARAIYIAVSDRCNR